MGSVQMAMTTDRGLQAVSAIAFALCCLASASTAQTPPAPPPALPVAPGQTSPGLPRREEVQPPVALPGAAPTVRIDSSRAIVEAPCPLAGLTLRVSIDKVRYVALGRAALAPPLAALLAAVELPATGEQPISGVCAIRDRANAALRRGGYIASVQIPPQEISRGELVLAVVVARLTEVRVRGDAGPHRAALTARIAQIRALDPLNEPDIERLLLLTSDVPGLSIQLALRPAGTAPGDVIGDLTVATHRFALFANVQNYGSRQLGRETGYVRGEFYGLLTGSDVAYAAGSSTLDFKEQQVAQLGYTTGIDSGGTTLGARATYAWSRPTLDKLDLRSQTIIAGIDIAHPLVRSLRTNVALSGGAELLEQRTRIYNGPVVAPLNRDKLRVAFARVSASYHVPGALTDRLFIGGTLEVRRGLDIFGASKGDNTPSPEGYALSRIGGDPQATVVRGDADASITLGPVFSLVGALRGQWTNHLLLNLEQYSIGNLTIGRGYDPGSNAGDRLVGIRFEPRARLPLKLPAVISVLGFFDSIWLWNLGANDTEARRSLTSWGGGLDVQLPGRLMLSVLYAQPRDKALLFDKRPPSGRLLLSLTAKFSPYVR
jgi:hemolysin activation/secretion protein